ncbi:MAG TPA: prephenate dehydrogenase/arogenate dehydrogenase family protein [Bacteroidota bacterium]|nr:prephenate dehydrogenase/arogenate dehydrogenase family protein [Bacteroidota bacterium]
MKRENLLIVGYGRFGRFIAGIVRTDFHVSVLESRKTVRPAAGLKRVTQLEIGNYPIVILAMPLHRLEAFLRREGRRFMPGAFVVDVSALKEAPMRWMKRYLPSSVSYAGLHPLFGPDSAREGLSRLTVAVCRGRSSNACHRRLVGTLKKYALKPVETNAVTHDKIITSTLFLTQWVGHLLGPHLPVHRPLIENPTAMYLRTIARRAAADPEHILKDLYRFNPYSRRMLGRLMKTARGLNATLAAAGYSRRD